MMNLLHLHQVRQTGKHKIIICLSLAILPAVCSFSQQKQDANPIAANNIIPKPVLVKNLNGKSIQIDQSTVIIASPQFYSQAEYLKEQIQDQCGLSLSIRDKSPKKQTAIILYFDSVKVKRTEMYVLGIKNHIVKINARDVPGLVHGIQTLLQMMPLQPQRSVSLSSLYIEDYPRFAYRGMHLDVSRHFFDVSFVKKYIDYLCFHKFNTFHWHLTDDQGWRIEIKSYPKLTETGAWRDSTLIGHFRDTPARYDGTRYGGYYTQTQVKDIVQYAAIRGITIIPEIDIPGHSRAIIASYPEFSTRPDTTWQVATTWGMFNRQNNVLAPNDKTFAFLKAVFDEIADLFPSPYIHVGGDECSKTWWKADPKTQAFMKEHGLDNETELQNYFIEQVKNDLQARGKKLIGWDEILEGKPDTAAIIMNWRGVTAAIEAAKENHFVIMAPGSFTYFNYSQTRNKDSLTAGGYLPLDKVYGFEPVPKELSQEEAGYILGAQGNLWTEYIQYPSKIEYMIFPRMTALSEALWTGANDKNFDDFKRRLTATAIPRYLFWNSSYCKDYEQWTIGK